MNFNNTKRILCIVILILLSSDLFAGDVSSDHGNCKVLTIVVHSKYTSIKLDVVLNPTSNTGSLRYLNSTYEVHLGSDIVTIQSDENLLTMSRQPGCVTTLVGSLNKI